MDASKYQTFAVSPAEPGDFALFIKWLTAYKQLILAKAMGGDHNPTALLLILACNA